MSEHRGFVASAAAACAAIAEQLDAQRVSIGWYESQQCKLIACSQDSPASLTTTDRSSINESMIEAINQQCTISNVNPQGIKRIAVSAKALARQQAGGSGVVISVPLAITTHVKGAVCIEFDSVHSARVVRGHDQVVAVTEILVPSITRMLSMANDLDRPWTDRTIRRLLQVNQQQEARQPSRRRLALLAIGAIALFGLCFPFEQNINSDAQVHGAEQRIVAAPTQGYLQTVNVRPGDQVRANQVLAQLGERELELKRDRLIGQVAQHRTDASTAIASGDRAAMAVAKSLGDQAKAQLALVNSQLELATVRTPISGIVIDGDLHQSIGSPVDRGQTLFTVAPANEWRVTVEMDERDISRITNNQSGSLYLSALPWEKVGVVVRRIAPSAKTSNSRNVFEVEASIPNPPTQLRPGLKGTVRLHVGHQSLIARMTQNIRDAVGRLFWRWNPW
jgi:multidrug resistance efflux pump